MNSRFECLLGSEIPPTSGLERPSCFSSRSPPSARLFHILNPTMSSEYKHTRLSSPSSIRLLTLLPSPNFSSPVHCEIHEVSLDDDEIEYEALSYVWGEPTPGHFVYINGNQSLQVTPNCLEALRYLRPKTSWFANVVRRGRIRNSTSKGRVLWVDAICIDQTPSSDSTEERNHQVTRMDAIYSQATRVLAWLGPGDDSTPRLLRRLRLMHWLNETSSSFQPAALGDAAGFPSRKLSDRMVYRGQYPCDIFEARYSYLTP